jgi:OOP family OmpA-OmpF porin
VKHTHDSPPHTDARRVPHSGGRADAPAAAPRASQALRTLPYLVLATALTVFLLSAVARADDLFSGPSGVVQDYDTTENGQDAGSRLTAASLYAADALAANLAGKAMPRGAILAASLADQEDLTRTCPLGRLVAHQVATRLAQYGYQVSESRLRANMAIQPHSGEFLLSRDTAKLATREAGAVAALVGTYLATESEVYISLRLVALDGGATLAACETALQNQGAVRRLLGQDDHEQAWARHVGRAPAFETTAAPAASGTAAPAPATDASVAAPLFDAPGQAEHAVTLSIHFDSDSARLNDQQAMADLDQIAQAMNTPQLLGSGFEIGGHTDSTGSARHNLDLSRQRAQTIKSYLAQHGVAPARLVTRGYGANNPVAPNTTEPGKAQNRRVVIRRLD